MFRAAHCQLARTQGRLARRAHADPRAAESGGRNALHRGGVSERLRQDQSRDADAAGGVQGLEGLHRRRRHRMAAGRRRRPAVGDQSRGRLFRRRARHQREVKSQRDADRSEHDTHFHQRRDDAGRRRLVGGHGRAGRRQDCSIGAASRGTRTRARRRRIRTAASPRRWRTIRCCRRMPKIRRACRSRRSFSAAGARPRCRWCSKSRDWTHGVFMGATMGSETTAAAAGKVGVVRRDPMAMLPFCGYNIGDYLRPLARDAQADHQAAADLHGQLVPQGRGGEFLWPGYGENMRVLKWMLDRIHGDGAARTRLRSVWCRSPRTSTSRVSKFHPSHLRAALAVDPASGRPRWLRRRIFRSDRTGAAGGAAREASGAGRRAGRQVRPSPYVSGARQVGWRRSITIG